MNFTLREMQIIEFKLYFCLACGDEYSASLNAVLGVKTLR
ncbi:hypothetical protein RA2_00493 [Roseovarius sp. A-2]|nr:hypothetical protein RA2_00493 [Roseovarius sp. A-2]